MQGFCAETGGAATLFMATFLGVPVSTTHTITGAIVGVGAARRRLGGALERGELDRLCLGDHDPGLGRGRRRDLLGVQVLVTVAFSSSEPVRAENASKKNLPDELQPDDAGHDQPDAGRAASRMAGSPKQDDAERRGADRADPGPDRIGGSDRQRLQRQAEQEDAAGHRRKRQHRRHQPRETFGIFQPDRPADLEQAGGEQNGSRP